MTNPKRTAIKPRACDRSFEVGEGAEYIYASFTANEYGEEFLFLVRPDRSCFITGDELDWELHQIGGGAVPVHGLLLSAGETAWLQSCWMLTRDLRPESSAQVPDDVLTFPVASEIWGISETTLKRHHDKGNLDAKRVGGAWLTTISAMEKAFGKPQIDVKEDDTQR